MFLFLSLPLFPSSLSKFYITCMCVPLFISCFATYNLQSLRIFKSNLFFNKMVIIKHDKKFKQV